MNHPSDEELLRAFAQGDEPAFARFYDRHARAVHACLRRVLGTEHDVEELMQEVFFRASLRWRSIRYVNGSAHDWLMSACEYAVEQRSRVSRRRPRETPVPQSAADSSDEGRGEELMQARAQVRAVEDIVARMDSLTQDIYRSSLVEGRTHAETAQALGLGAPMVRKRYQRLREQLRERLGVGDG